MQSIPRNPITSFWLDPNEWKEVNKFDYLKDTELNNGDHFDSIIIGIYSYLSKFLYICLN